MASASTCPGCGHRVPGDLQRCPACGVALDRARLSMADDSHDPELRTLRRSQQQGFAWRWVLVSLGVFLVVQFLPLLVLRIDGWAGIGVSVGVWFVGGVVVGFVSPGKTILEPAVAAFGTAIPTMLYLWVTTPEGLGPSGFSYVIAGALGTMLGLFGARLGETIQDLTRG